MPNLLSILVFFGIFAIGLFLRYLASNNLLEEYSNERSNVRFNIKGNWSLNRKMFNERSKIFYIISNFISLFWLVYIIILIF